MLANRFFFLSSSALFLVHLLDAIYSSFAKWTFSIRCASGVCVQTTRSTEHSTLWRCRKLKHLFAHSMRNIIQSRQFSDGMVSFYAVGVHNTASAKQLKMNFSIILFGDCVNVRRTRLTPSTTLSRPRIQKCDRNEGTNSHPKQKKGENENEAKEYHNLIGLNVYKLCCHVQRIMCPCVCAP